MYKKSIVITIFAVLAAMDVFADTQQEISPPTQLPAQPPVVHRAQPWSPQEQQVIIDQGGELKSVPKSSIPMPVENDVTKPQ